MQLKIKQNLNAGHLTSNAISTTAKINKNKHEIKNTGHLTSNAISTTAKIIKNKHAIKNTLKNNFYCLVYYLLLIDYS